MQELAYIVRDAHLPDITKDAKHILWHLASREGENEASWPSTRTMSLCTNISQKGVLRAIQCLKKHNLIEVESGKDAGRPNRYRVTLPEAVVSSWYEQNGKRRKVGQRVPPKVGQGVRPTVGQDVRPGGTNAAPGSDTVTHRKETNMSNKNNQQKICSSVSTSQAAPQQTDAHGTWAKNMELVGKRPIAKDEAVWVAYNLGMPPDECEAFWRYNQPKGWPLLETMSLLDIAKTWRDQLKRRCPSAISDERARRESEKFMRECYELEKRRAAGEFD